MVHTHSSSHPVGLSSLQLSTHRRRFYPQQKDDLLCSSPPANCKQIEVLSDGFKTLVAGSTSSPTKSSSQMVPHPRWPPYFFLLSPLSVSPLTKRPSRRLHPTVREARCHRGRRPVGQATWGWTSRRSAAGWQESYVLRSTVGEAHGACCLFGPGLPLQRVVALSPPPARLGGPAGGRLLQRCGGPVTTH
ncbi:hypothetical protein PVAP13_3KG409800 [Panicum virgatum]|uniref:Uncharacterized protein n=1 Tax=Panicum virgatum TaxID=38727 RepID=A0A8T0VBD9_PANVG|nr:hypothetical protein PVAP13_3KG409800 [Panicum virgatum]